MLNQDYHCGPGQWVKILCLGRLHVNGDAAPF